MSGKRENWFLRKKLVDKCTWTWYIAKIGEWKWFNENIRCCWWIFYLRDLTHEQFAWTLLICNVLAMGKSVSYVLNVSLTSLKRPEIHRNATKHVAMLLKLRFSSRSSKITVRVFDVVDFIFQPPVACRLIFRPITLPDCVANYVDLDSEWNTMLHPIWRSPAWLNLFNRR